MRRYVIDIIILTINSIQAMSLLIFNITIKTTKLRKGIAKYVNDMTNMVE
jgi:hypothetical protein